MFNRRTLFVLGAGASHELKMPLGIKLAEIIHNKLNLEFNDWGDFSGGPDKALARDLRSAFQSIRGWGAAARVIHDGILGAHSIDEFLEIHKENDLVVRIGKAAIARSILEAERGCDLFYINEDRRHTVDLGRLGGAWHIRFLRRLVQSVPRSSVEQIFEKVSFVSFNYDRCLEYFLFHSLQSVFGINAANANSALENLTIIHPFGSVGDLSEVDFGGPPDGVNPDIVHILKGIRTYTEVTGSD